MTQRHLKDVELEAYLDGEFPPEKFAGANRHLATCGPCARRLDDLAEVHLQLRSLANPRLSADQAEALDAALMEAIRQEARQAGQTAPAGLLLPEQPIGAPLLPVGWKIPVAAAIGASWIGLLLLIWLVPWPVWTVLAKTISRLMAEFFGLVITSAVSIWGEVIRLQLRFDLLEPGTTGILLLSAVLAVELVFIYLLQPLASYERRGR